jgi:hypothetical protein
MKYAIVKNNAVVNVIEYEEQPSTPPNGFEEGNVAVQADHVSIGWSYINGAFTNPNAQEQTQNNLISLTDMILSNPDELTKLKQALGIA